MIRTNKKNKKGKIIINKELCKGCGYCINACPKGLITIDISFNSMGNPFAVFNQDDVCTGCTLCARMCPEIAIEVWRE